VIFDDNNGIQWHSSLCDVTDVGYDTCMYVCYISQGISLILISFKR